MPNILVGSTNNFKWMKSLLKGKPYCCAICIFGWCYARQQNHRKWLNGYLRLTLSVSVKIFFFTFFNIYFVIVRLFLYIRKYIHSKVCAQSKFKVYRFKGGSMLSSEMDCENIQLLNIGIHAQKTFKYFIQETCHN